MPAQTRSRASPPARASSSGATATLTGNACAAFSGGWSTVTSPDAFASPVSVPSIATASVDHVGNEATYSSGAVVKVDLSAPAVPIITLWELRPYAFVSGTEIFLNTNQSGSYDVSATSAVIRPASGIAKVTFPGGIDDLSSPYHDEATASSTSSARRR